MNYQVSVAPKDLSHPHDCEDAYAPEQLSEEPPWCVAIADGASQTFAAGDWARLLVRSYVDGRFPDALPDLRTQWAKGIDREALSWFQRERLRGGAQAALVGLRIAADGGWDATAIGDCCLFQVRAETLIAAFPYRRPDDFSSQPPLVSTAARQDKPPRTETGMWRPGDTFYLMSDALAQWFLDEAVLRDGKPWRWLTRPFRTLVAELRACGRLRVDDTTLAVLRL